MPRKDLELTRKKWDEEYKRCYDLGMMDLNKDLELKDAYAHVKKYINSKNGLFIEAGCGPSKLSCLLARDGIKTVGVDLSLQGLTLANKLFEREGVSGLFVCGNILEMPFKDDVFSFVYTGGVLEHFRDTQKAVNEIYRCLAPSSFTTNTVPCLSLSYPYRLIRWGNIPDVFLIGSLVEYIERKVLKERFMRFGYEKSFTIRKIRKIFKNAGFSRIEVGLFETYYPLEPIKNDFLKKLLTKIANTRPFWPMIYVSGEKNESNVYH